MSVTDVDEFLAHYGRKGMKWGVVRSEKELAREPGGKSKAKVAVEAAVAKRAENKTAKREEKAQKFDVTAAELKKTSYWQPGAQEECLCLIFWEVQSTLVIIIVV